jgi:hypothetical protein
MVAKPGYCGASNRSLHVLDNADRSTYPFSLTHSALNLDWSRVAA